MGREAKILLGLLGLLAGVFCGVLSMKLFVHRPPNGVGPEVRGIVAAGAPSGGSSPRVPTSVGLPASAFAAAPPLTADAPVAVAAAADSLPDTRHDEGRSPAIDQVADAVAEAVPGGAATRFADRERGGGDVAGDRLVAPVGYEEPVGPLIEPLVVSGGRGAFRPEAATVTGPVAAPVAAAGMYEVRPGDSWWQIAERAYGDGRLYRALFAWNKGVDPRVSLEPGTRLEIPTRNRLAAAWQRLMPR